MPSAGCNLETNPTGEDPHPVAADGRFMVLCPQGYALLDTRTDAITILPHGPEWSAVGARYVEGRGDERCRLCVVLFEIGTAKLSERPEDEVADLDRSGAPRVCPALRREVLATGEGRQSRFLAYDNGLLAHATSHGDVRIDTCRGHERVPGGHSTPLNFDLCGGLLTWDTGHSASEYFNRVEEFSHGTLVAYRLSGHKRRTWALPSLAVEGVEYQRGVFGYSTHTANTVFWVGSRVLNDGFVERSSVYAARF
jgi:hypothetical protein